MFTRKIITDTETNVQTIKKSKRTSNCLICALYPFILFGSWIGISGMTFSCPHTGKPNTKCFKKSNILIIISLPLCMVLTFDLLNNISLLLGSDIDKRTKFKIVPDIAFIMATFIIMFCCMISTSTRVTEFNGIMEIIENRQVYGVEILMKESFAKKHSNLGLQCGILAIFFSIVYGLVLNFQDACAIRDDCGPFRMMMGMLKNVNISIFKHPRRNKNYRHLPGMFQYYVQLTSICDLVLAQKIYKELFQNCFDALEDLLEKKQIYLTSGIDNIWSTSDHRISASIDKELKKIKELYTSLVYNFSLLEVYLSPLVALWFTVTVMIIVGNTYLLVVWMTSTTTGYNSYYFLLQIRSFGSVFGIALYMYGLDIVGEMNGDIISYLYLYPITKLNFAEAEQVEMMIRTLCLQKPVLRISDVITLGIGILPSIGSTVLTYVLVALQFNVAAEGE